MFLWDHFFLSVQSVRFELHFLHPQYLRSCFKIIVSPETEVKN